MTPPDDTYRGWDPGDGEREDRDWAKGLRHIDEGEPFSRPPLPEPEPLPVPDPVTRCVVLRANHGGSRRLGRYCGALVVDGVCARGHEVTS